MNEPSAAHGTSDGWKQLTAGQLADFLLHYEIGKKHRVKVATSDGPEQLIILGHGALRVSASGFREEVEQVRGQIKDLLTRNNHQSRNRGAIRAAMEKAGAKKEAP